eukprot:2313722-Pyramimonas_sp.AAC.1
MQKTDSACQDNSKRPIPTASGNKIEYGQKEILELQRIVEFRKQTSKSQQKSRRDLSCQLALQRAGITLKLQATS